MKQRKLKNPVPTIIIGVILILIAALYVFNDIPWSI